MRCVTRYRRYRAFYLSRRDAHLGQLSEYRGYAGYGLREYRKTVPLPPRSRYRFRNSQLVFRLCRPMVGRPRLRAGIVEDCLTLDTGEFVRSGLLESLCSRVRVVWNCAVSGEQIGSAYVTGDPDCDGSSPAALNITLFNKLGGLSGSGTVPLDVSLTFFGGLRYWFRCPTQRDGRLCGARTRILYLPPLAKFFACRDCHDLTYASCRASHAYDTMFAGLTKLIPNSTPELVKEFLRC